MIHSGQVAFYDGLKDLLVPIDEVHQADWNYNNGDVEEIEASIQENGMFDCILVDQSNRDILAGNGTWEACKNLGAEVIPVVWLDPDQATAWRINVAHNRVASLARPDPGLLLETLKKIEADSGSVIGTGYTREQMAEMIAASRIPLDTDRLQPDSRNWPTLSIQMPPELLKAFMEITDEADDNRERFEVLLRMAGWDG